MKGCVINRLELWDGRSLNCAWPIIMAIMLAVLTLLVLGVVSIRMDANGFGPLEEVSLDSTHGHSEHIGDQLVRDIESGRAVATQEESKYFDSVPGFPNTMRSNIAGDDSTVYSGKSKGDMSTNTEGGFYTASGSVEHKSRGSTVSGGDTVSDEDSFFTTKDQATVRSGGSLGQMNAIDDVFSSLVHGEFCNMDLDNEHDLQRAVTCIKQRLDQALGTTAGGDPEVFSNNVVNSVIRAQSTCSSGTAALVPNRCSGSTMANYMAIAGKGLLLTSSLVFIAGAILITMEESVTNGVDVPVLNHSPEKFDAADATFWSSVIAGGLGVACSLCSLGMQYRSSSMGIDTEHDFPLETFPITRTDSGSSQFVNPTINTGESHEHKLLDDSKSSDYVEPDFQTYGHGEDLV